MYIADLPCSCEATLTCHSGAHSATCQLTHFSFYHPILSKVPDLCIGVHCLFITHGLSPICKAPSPTHPSICFGTCPIGEPSAICSRNIWKCDTSVICQKSGGKNLLPYASHNTASWFTEWCECINLCWRPLMSCYKTNSENKQFIWAASQTMESP